MLIVLGMGTKLDLLTIIVEIWLIVRLKLRFVRVLILLGLVLISKFVKDRRFILIIIEIIILIGWKLSICILKNLKGKRKKIKVASLINYFLCE